MNNMDSGISIPGTRHNFRIGLWLILAAAFVLRLVLAPVWLGYEADMRTFIAWADHAYNTGLFGVYTDGMFLDYPPGYLYVLYILGMLHHVFHIPWEGTFSILLMKLPASLADLVLGLLIFQEASRRFSLRGAYALTLGVVLNPALWLNSSIWGQIDSIFMIFVLLFLRGLRQKKFAFAACMLAIAVLIKPQGLLLGPFLLLALAKQRDFKAWLQAFGTGAVTFLLPVVPFMIHKGFSWIFTLYFGTLGSYPYASLNAFNLFALFGGNFTDQTKPFLFLSYQTWGTIGLLGSLLAASWLYLRIRNRSGAGQLAAALFMASAFILANMMHERYLFYAVPLLAAAFIWFGDRKLLFVYAGFSLTFVLNVGYVLVQSWRKLYLIPVHDTLMLLVSACNIGLLIYAWKLGWTLAKKDFGHSGRAKGTGSGEMDLSVRSQVQKSDFQAIRKQGRSDGDLEPENSGTGKESKGSRFLGKKDFLYMGILIVVYTIIACINLGSAKAPETYWQPSEYQENIVVDLGSTQSIDRINSFAGDGEGKYSYWFSEDGIVWDHEIPVESDYTKVFTWASVQPNVKARYVKIVTDKTGFRLHEVAFFNHQSEKPLPVLSVNTSGGDPSSAEGNAGYRLFDEQKDAPYEPTYLNGTYFDEIYHARTAYEHLHQIEPYESTHPPLGKIFISAGIWLFGMNPLGWRIVGTLFGVGMIPLMYAFGKRLFGRSEYALIPAVLFTFDFMHFAQTRIATIDVYGVFFIMLMFYYMYRYMTISFYKVSLWKTWIPLGLAGLFFGIGAASKWIVLYGGAGLAVLLAISLIDRYKEYKAAKLHVLEYPEDEENQRKIRVFPRYTLYTLLVCLVFYVIIPALIYLLSYIPFMMVPGPGHGLKDVLTYQVHMYQYHSHLVATHPFASPWWEWPLMITPIWYYKAMYAPADTVSSIVSFGNPLVWWPGFAAVLYTIYRIFRKMDRRLLVLLIAYLSQYLPWMLVPRLTFIYHYFAMVPFMVLMLSYWVIYWMKKKPETRKRWVVAYLAGAVLLFIWFYPLLSGLPVSKTYTSWLHWLPGWRYF